MSDKHTATAYALVVPVYQYWNKDRIDHIKITKIYQNKPDSLVNGVLVKVRIEVPDDAFEPFEPPVVTLEYIKPEVEVSVDG